MEQHNGTARQRSMRSEEQILSLLDEHEKSGFTVKEFCEVSDINEATFYSWIKKYKKGEEEQKGFTSIEIVPSTKPLLFAEVNGIKIYQQVAAEYLKILAS